MLRATIVRSDGYRSSVRTRFRDACYELLGEDDEGTFRTFDAGGGEEPVEVTDHEIQMSVRQSPRFEARYVDLIQRSYATLMGGEVTPRAFLATMLDRFREDPTFLLEDLHTLIRSISPVDPVSSLDEVVFRDKDSDLDDDQGEDKEPGRPLPATVNSQEHILAAADEVFGRPWWAHEYIAYGAECAGAVDIRGFVASLLCEHTSSWELARGAHARLLGEVLDEVDFVRRYVGTHRRARFAETLIGDLLASPGYCLKVRSRLRSVQMRLYDMALTEEDLTRLCLQAQGAGVGVGDDEVSALLHSHRRECDALVSEVVGVYVEVLSREPDHLELMEEMEMFRGEAVPGSARIELAVRLSKGYEFHDVVKTRLRSAYHSAAGVHVPMQVLYAMLEQVLACSESALRGHGGAAEGLTHLVEEEVRGRT